MKGLVARRSAHEFEGRLPVKMVVILDHIFEIKCRTVSCVVVRQKLKYLSFSFVGTMRAYVWMNGTLGVVNTLPHFMYCKILENVIYSLVPLIAMF